MGQTGEPLGRGDGGQAKEHGKGIVGSFRHQVVDETLAEEGLRIVHVDERLRDDRDHAAGKGLALERIRIGVKATRAAEQAVEGSRDRRFPVARGTPAR